MPLSHHITYSKWRWNNTKQKIDMQEEKFTSKKSFVQECTSKDLSDGTLPKFEAKVF